MVIQQFNKLIRNKWVWGAFAIIVSAAFCFDDLFSTRSNEARAIGEAGKLGGEDVSAADFTDCVNFVKDSKQERESYSYGKVNQEAWKVYAALKTAEKDGIAVSDAHLAERIRMMFSFGDGFSSARYEQLVRERLQKTPKQFEDSLRRSLTLRDGVMHTLLGAAVWVSPEEVERKLADFTDKFTIKVARFSQSADEAKAVKVNEDGLKMWYAKNLPSLALPERIRIRYIRYSAGDTNLLAKMSVSEDEMHDYYDTSTERYTVKGTNGVETVKTFDEVKGEIEKELRRVAAVECLTTNLQRRAYANLAAGENAAKSRLDEIAKADGKKVETSNWFSLDGAVVPGFMSRTDDILPGANGFVETVAELDSESQDLRYGVVASAKNVWLIEKLDVSPAHTPSFDEAKEKIKKPALESAKEDALKASIAKVLGKGKEGVLATKNVSTNFSFVVAEMAPNAFPDQRAIVSAAMKLEAGECSEPVILPKVVAGTVHGLVVVCETREPGDLITRSMREESIRGELMYSQLSELYEAWLDDNLNRQGFVTTALSSVEEAESAE